MNENLYQDYRREREARSHAEIVAEGRFPADELEAYCMRYDLVQSGVVDAGIQRDKLARHAVGAPDPMNESSVDGRPLRLA